MHPRVRYPVSDEVFCTVYLREMSEGRQTAAFREGLNVFRPPRVTAGIGAKIGRLRIGNFGDANSPGGGVSELRFDFGPGHRI